MSLLSKINPYISVKTPDEQIKTSNVKKFVAFMATVALVTAVVAPVFLALGVYTVAEPILKAVVIGAITLCSILFMTLYATRPSKKITTTEQVHIQALSQENISLQHFLSNLTQSLNQTAEKLTQTQQTLAEKEQELKNTKEILQLRNTELEVAKKEIAIVTEKRNAGLQTIAEKEAELKQVRAELQTSQTELQTSDELLENVQGKLHMPTSIDQVNHYISKRSRSKAPSPKTPEMSSSRSLPDSSKPLVSYTAPLSQRQSSQASSQSVGRDRATRSTISPTPSTSPTNNGQASIPAAPRSATRSSATPASTNPSSKPIIARSVSRRTQTITPNNPTPASNPSFNSNKQTPSRAPNRVNSENKRTTRK